MSYVNLHCHSSYSVRDGISRLNEIVSRSKELGMSAVCISEHGSMASCYRFYKECKSQDIKPIIACEFYYATDIKEKEKNYHLLLIAKNNEGYKNLCRLSSEAYINGFYRKPRIDFELIKKYRDGIIASTACMAGYAQQLLLNGEVDACNAELDRFHSLFGDDFYLEIHNHNIPEEAVIRDHFRSYGREKGVKCIYGNDSHYILKQDKEIHNIFKQIAYNSVGMSSDDAFSGDGYWIMSRDELLERFTQDEIDNTQEIADKCNIGFKFTKYYLPQFDIPEKGKDAHEYLRDMCWDSLKRRGFADNKVYVDRLNYELGMLHMADLENYLLIVADYCSWARNNDIPVGPGRGSMGGSIVSWLTGITEVDPIHYGLLFGRAINVGRSLQYDFGI